MKRTLRALGFVALVSTLAPQVADACGGCFAPPQTVQVVTDHRMVLALSNQQTTLWDQFRYTGRPQDFSWILPIRFTERTRVALATNEFMTTADQLTAPIVQPPRLSIPAGCVQAPSAGGAVDASAAADAGVTVLREEVIGPYAVSIIRGTDAMAVRNWLRDNGYVVPSAVEPIIDHYTAMNMDYIALRLRPGEGIDRMSPVRVTFEGYQPRLPLRMIAAGVADKVGLSLVVLAPSRIEAENFPNGEVRSSDLVWDWTGPRSPSQDFLNAFERLNNAAGGRLWLTESSTTQDSATWTQYGLNLTRFRPDAGVSANDAGGTMTPVANVEDDVAVAFQGLGPSPWVTRLRADLLGRMLDRDLTMRASDLGARVRLYEYGEQRNAPTFPGCVPQPDGGAQTRVDAGLGIDGGAPLPVENEASGGASCTVRPAPSQTSKLPPALCLAALAGVAWRLRRRRP